jgi:DNA-binding transcriptional MerR regulator
MSESRIKLEMGTGRSAQRDRGAGIKSERKSMKKQAQKKQDKKDTRKRVENGLKSKDVIQLILALEEVKIDYDRLYYYEHTGLLVPSLRKSQGRGHPKLYSTEDFIILRWLVSLQKSGIPVSRFRSILSYLKKKMPEVLSEPHNWSLVTDGKSVQFKHNASSRKVDVLEDSGQYLFSLEEAGKKNRKHPKN